MSQITYEDVRDFLRDHPQYNILLDEEEHLNGAIQKAMSYAEDMWLLTPPAGVGGSIPRPLMLIGASAWLLRSMGMLQIRNQATVRDGMISPIGIDDKAQIYLQTADTFQREFTSLASEIKINRNCESAYGSLGSGYARNVFKP